ncbi:MAG: RsiV family protein [Lachnospiraceae bacterium]|nr:RsiV family protein [Lachnospiraceae bacterium]
MKKLLELLRKTFVLCLALILLAGCGLQNGPVRDDPDTEDADDEDDRDEEDDYEQDDEKEADDQPAVAESVPDTVLLSYNQTSDVICLFDENGTLYKKIERRELAENLTESEIAQYRVYNSRESEMTGSDAEYLRSRVCAVGGGFVFFTDYRFSEESGEYIYIVYAISEDEHRLYPIWDGVRSFYVETCEYYDGRIYVDYSLGYDDAGRFLGEAEKCFAFDASTGSFTEEDPGTGEMLRGANDAGLWLVGASVMSNEHESFKHTLDECGFVLGSAADRYYTVDAAGSTELLYECEGNINFSYYGPECVIYSISDYEKETASLRIFDIQGRKSYALTAEWNAAGFLGREDWKYYYYYQSQEEYGIKHDYICEYNYMNGETSVLYEERSIPGSGISFPGIDGFRVFGGNVYKVDFKDGSLRWVRADIKNGSAVFEDIDCPIRDVEIFKFGTVVHASYGYCCPDCGTALILKYGEGFQLDGRYSSYADKINASLRDKLNAFVGTGTESAYTGDIFDSPCESHQEHPTWYRETEDYNVAAVNVIDDRYLTVDMSGDWYGGGAHGMPMRDQYLYDLKTGEELTFADFYNGTEEDFKTLIAEMTVEDYESYGEYPPYCGHEDLDDLYEQAYASAWIEEDCIEFTEDGIIYYYPPYEMGPYAAGYIEFSISYIKLFNRGTLAE